MLELAGASGDNALCLGLAGAENVYLNDIAPLETAAFEEKVRRLPVELQKKFHTMTGDCFEVFKDPSYESFFDIIYTRNIFHFFLGEKRERFIKLLNRLLKPGGTIVLTANAPNNMNGRDDLSKDTYVFKVHIAQMMELTRPPAMKELFQEVYPVTDEHRIFSSDPLKPVFHPVIMFSPIDIVYQAGFNLLNEEHKKHLQEMCNKLVAQYGLMTLVTKGIAICLQEITYVAYTVESLQQACAQSNFKILDAMYTDNKGHITHDAKQRSMVTIMLEKIIHQCDSCKKSGTALKCSRCKKVHYCGVECQKADWPNHKASCKPL